MYFASSLSQHPRKPGCPRRLRCELLEPRAMLSAAGLTEAMPTMGEFDAESVMTVAEFSEAPIPIEEDSTLLSRFVSIEQLQQYLIQDALERYAGMFGSTTQSYWGWKCGFDDIMLEGGVTRLAVMSVADEDYSGTNTQVAGVDEADLVETDGSFLYVLSGRELIIVDVRVADQPEVASRVEFDAQPFAMYLAGDRLTVLSSRYDHEPGDDLLFVRSWGPPSQPRHETSVAVLDVSDRQTPTLVQETSLDGRYVDSRAVGNSVYLVLRDDFMLPPPEWLPEPVAIDDPEPDDGERLAEILAADMWCPLPEGTGVYETKQQYLERILGQVLQAALPGFSSVGPDGQPTDSGLLVEAMDLHHPITPGDGNLLSVVVFDMAADAPGPVSSIGLPTSGAEVTYVSADRMYVLTPQGQWWRGEEQQTEILQLDFNHAEGTVELTATGTVPGHVLNQFSVDRYDGRLRVATTLGNWAWGAGQGDSQNNVYVLQQSDQALEIVGRLENLAPGEKIYSARFSGDRAFLVTFRQVDPLFVINLTDPTAPQVAGELKIPGFSNYLHAVDDGYLIGLGRDADEDTGLYEDPQVSLFDVGDWSDPELVDRFTIETGRAGGLGVFDDHHAIAYFPDQHVLTVSVPEFNTTGSDGGWHYVYRNSLWVFRIDVGASAPADAAGDVALLGKIEHTSDVRRSVRIGELLYAISVDTVTVHDIFDPASLVGQVDLGLEAADPAGAFRMPGLIGSQAEPIGPFGQTSPAMPDWLETLRDVHILDILAHRNLDGAELSRIALWNAAIRSVTDAGQSPHDRARPAEQLEITDLLLLESE